MGSLLNREALTSQTADTKNYLVNPGEENKVPNYDTSLNAHISDRIRAEKNPGLIKNLLNDNYRSHFRIDVSDIIQPLSYKRYSRHIHLSEDLLGTGEIKLLFSRVGMPDNNIHSLTDIPEVTIPGAAPAAMIEMIAKAIPDFVKLFTKTKLITNPFSYTIDVMPPQISASRQFFDSDLSNTAAEVSRNKKIRLRQGSQVKVYFDTCVGSTAHIAFDVLNEDPQDSILVNFLVIGQLKMF